MLYATGDDQELAGGEGNLLVAEVHGECAAVDEEEFVFVLMVVPVEGTLELDEFDALTVEVGGDAG